MRVLVVEDEELIGKGITTGLKQEGYVVDWFSDGLDARYALEVERYDVIVLDLGLPGCTGNNLLEWARNKQIDTPVLVLTARDTIRDKVGSLDRGADDYMVKPFDLDELAARLRALIRRRTGRASPVIEWEEVMLDPVARQVTFKGEPVELSVREYSLLEILLENAGKVVSRSRLMESLYSWDQTVESNVLEVHIHHLRKKLGNEMIRTIRGVGYTLRK